MTGHPELVEGSMLSPRLAVRPFDVVRPEVLEGPNGAQDRPGALEGMNPAKRGTQDRLVEA